MKSVRIQTRKLWTLTLSNWRAYTIKGDVYQSIIYLQVQKYYVAGSETFQETESNLYASVLYTYNCDKIRKFLKYFSKHSCESLNSLRMKNMEILEFQRNFIYQVKFYLPLGIFNTFNVKFRIPNIEVLLQFRAFY